MAAIICAALAAMLRMWHIDHGLPDFTEEAVIFRKALALWGPTGSEFNLNPHWFVYPSLTIYLQFLGQLICYLVGGFSTPADFLLGLATDPSKAVIVGRSVAVVADVATVVLVGRIARRFGDLPSVLAMGIVALAPVMIQTSRLLYTDSVMCALAIAAIDRLLAYRDHGDWKRLVVAAGLIGLAAGAKYPAALLLVPLGIAAWQREPRPRALGLWALAASIAGLAMLCTTPFLLTSWSEFVRDAAFTGEVALGGSLGKLRGLGIAYYLVGLGKNLGWVGLGLLTSSVLMAIRGPFRDAASLLWASWFVLFAPIASVPVEADRYLVPLIAVSATLVAAGAQPILNVLRSIGGRLAAGGLIVVVGLQPAWSGTTSAMVGRSTTQREARKWCEAHLRGNDLLLSEAYGPNLLTNGQRAGVMAGPVFRAASLPARVAYQSQRVFHLVWLPLLVGGYASVRLPTPQSQEIAVYPHAVDWNAAAYDVRLLQGVDYVVTTSAVRGRFAADTARFREQAHFYAFLDDRADSVALFVPDHEIEGPQITIYRLTPVAREAMSLAGKLDSLWWARTVPASFKSTVEALLGAGLQMNSIPGLPLWAQPLRMAYAERYGPFADDLAQNLAALGQLRAAEDIAMAGLTVLPEDVTAALIYAQVAGQMGKWADVERVLSRSTPILGRYGPIPAEVLLARAEALLQTGNRVEAESVLMGLMERGDPSSSLAAQQRLRELHGRR